VHREGEPKWFLTKESGKLPLICGGLGGLLIQVDGAMQRREARSVFAVKIMREVGEMEVLVSRLCGRHVSEFQKQRLPYLRAQLAGGSWADVLHACCWLAWSNEGATQAAAEGMMGWRRVTGPEIQVGYLPTWWSGVSDAIGCTNGDGLPWLRCPCGMYFSG
jgi:hypothetical protein